MAEQDALRDAKFSSGLFLNDFPAKIRVLTLDALVYTDQWANTKYAFVVFNQDSQSVQILDKGPGFASRFQEIHNDEDFGSDLRKIDVKITTNGKQNKEIRYTITPIGSPAELTADQKKIIKDAGIDLEAIIKKKAPNALRLSEINAGASVPESTVEPTPSQTDDEVVIEDVGEEVNLADIPF